MSIKMQALAKQYYGGRQYLNGDEFFAVDERDANDLAVLGLARRKAEDRVLEATGASVAPVTEATQHRRSGKYRHREVSARR